MLPAKIELERRAVALDRAAGQFFKREPHVLTINQSLSHEAVAVQTAGLVEAPVFGDAQGRVVLALLAGVDLRSTGRRDFEHKVWRLALIGDHVTVLFEVELGVDPERDQQVRHAPWDFVDAACNCHIAVSGDQCRFRTAEVLDQMVRMASRVQIVVTGHFVRIPKRRLRQLEMRSVRRMAKG